MSLLLMAGYMSDEGWGKQFLPNIKSQLTTPYNLFSIGSFNKLFNQ
jgi:hypothetical protein